MRSMIFAILTIALLGLTRSEAGAQVDLAIDGISKQKKNIHIQIRNLGKHRSPETKLSVWFQNNDNLFALKNHLLAVPHLKAGAKKTFVIKHPDQKNVIHLLVTAKVDPATRIPETNERNNLMQKVIRLVPASRPIPTKPMPKLPDLKVSSISKRGNDYHIKVVNYGDSQSTPCILATWVVDKETLKVTKVERYVSAIKIGGTQTLKVDRVPRAKGKVTVTAVIDSRKKLKERSETNNRLEITLSPAKPVEAVADLIVASIDVPSPTLINVTIRNQSTGTTGRRCRVRMEIFEKDRKRRLYLTAQPLPRLDRNQTHTLRFESKVKLRRPMIIKIMPDVDNVIRETNERNNSTLRVY